MGKEKTNCVSGIELPLIIWEVSPSYFMWEFKKEETQKVERAWSFHVSKEEEGRQEEDKDS